MNAPFATLDTCEKCGCPYSDGGFGICPTCKMEIDEQRLVAINGESEALEKIAELEDRLLGWQEGCAGLDNQIKGLENETAYLHRQWIEMKKLLNVMGNCDARNGEWVRKKILDIIDSLEHEEKIPVVQLLLSSTIGVDCSGTQVLGHGAGIAAKEVDHHGELKLELTIESDGTTYLSYAFVSKEFLQSLIDRIGNGPNQ